MLESITVLSPPEFQDDAEAEGVDSEGSSFSEKLDDATPVETEFDEDSLDETGMILEDSELEG